MKQKSLIALTLFLAIRAALFGQDVFQSIRNGDLKAVKEFFEKNPDRLEMQDLNKMTPLMFASFFGQAEVAAFLIEMGAAVNYRRGEESCLHQAAQMNQRSIVALLLGKGADMEISKPRTPLYYALSSGAKEAAELLIERGAAVPVNSYLFHNAVRKGIRAAVDPMIAKGADLLSLNNTGGTLLHSTAEGGVATLVELMLAKGADINALDRYGRRPIHLAALNGHLAMVEQLIRKGADKDIKTLAGATAYDLARSGGHRDLASWLAAQGARVRDFQFLETPGDLYFGLSKPGERAEPFALGIISSPDELEHGVPAWSPDGNEVVWSTFGRTYRMIKSDERWTLPEVSPLYNKYKAMHIAFSPDGKRLYFDSDSAMDGTGKKKDADIWFLERRGKEWSEPKNPGPSVNSGQVDRFPSIVRNGNLYFASDYDLFRSVYKDGRYLPREKLGGGINTEYYELACFIAPDESYLIFSSSRPGPDGKEGDLDSYISFRKSDGLWMAPQAFGIKHGVKENFFISLSPDGRFLFFGAGDVQWIDAGIINTLRDKNAGEGLLKKPNIVRPKSIVVPTGSGGPVLIDGIFSKGEWDDALSYEISGHYELFLKTESEILYIGIKAPEPMDVLVTELWIVLDPNHAINLHSSLDPVEGIITFPADDDEPLGEIVQASLWDVNRMKAKSKMEGKEYKIYQKKFSANRLIMRIMTRDVVGGTRNFRSYPSQTTLKDPQNWVELILH